MTLIAVYDNDGCRGRCDARCYNAKCDHCDCICHGRNHGAGLKKAMDNTEKLAEEWIEDYNQKYPGEKLKYKVNRAKEQLSLPL